MTNSTILRETELNSCNFVKTILMLLVVLYHSTVFWTKNWFTNDPIFNALGLQYLSEWLNSFHIYAFTLVAGYVFYHNKYEKGIYRQFRPFIINKIKRLLVPYMFVAFIWAAPMHYAFIKCDFYEIINKYVLATEPSQLWFLIMLFDVFLIFFLLSDFFKKHCFRGFIVILIFFCISIIGKYFLPNIFLIWTALGFIPFFWLGFQIRQHEIKIVMGISPVIFIILDLLLFMFIQYIGQIDSIIIKILMLGFNFVLHILGALMAFVVLQAIAQNFKWENGLFLFICKRSMAVYLFHQQLIYIFIVLLNGVVNPYIHAMVNFIGALVISLIMTTVLMKFRMTRFLIGEK